MVRANAVKEKLAAGERVFGCFIPLSSPEIVEIIALAGFDFALLDSEHGPLNAETTYRLMLAAEARGIEPFVRVGERDKQTVLKFLDAGATGIMTPQVNTAAEAQIAISGTKFATVGSRGLAGMRTFDFGMNGTLDTFVEPLNDRVLNMIQFENQHTLSELDAMLALPGLDVLFIGPSDLAQSLGLPGQPNHPDVTAVADQVIARCKEAGIKTGTVAYTPALLEGVIERGFDMIVASVTTFLASSAQAYMRHAQESMNAANDKAAQ